MNFGGGGGGGVGPGIQPPWIPGRTLLCPGSDPAKYPGGPWLYAQGWRVPVAKSVCSSMWLSWLGVKRQVIA